MGHISNFQLRLKNIKDKKNKLSQNTASHRTKKLIILFTSVVFDNALLMSCMLLTLILLKPCFHF